MSADQDQARLIAERIARRLSPEANAPERNGDVSSARSTDDLAALRAGLTEIQRRLAHIELHIARDENRPINENVGGSLMRGNATVTRSPWLSGTYVPATAHPSDERFGISEAVSELVDYFESEKMCGMEPGGKPCDHCGMCSSRGF